MYYTFKCSLCDQRNEWRDGYPQTADEVRIVWVDNGVVKKRTMYEKDRCFICKSCMDTIVDGQVTCTDAQGSRVVANLVMYSNQKEV